MGRICHSRSLIVFWGFLLLSGPGGVVGRSRVPKDSTIFLSQKDINHPIITVPTSSTPTPSVPTVAAPYSNTDSSASSTPNSSTTSSQSWCIASQSASHAELQKALDFACGPGGASCLPIQDGKECFSPNTVANHASFAFNDLYVKNGTQVACDFNGTALLTSTDPSSGTCRYPSINTSTSILDATDATGSMVYGSVGPRRANSSSRKAAGKFFLTCFLAMLVG